MTIRSQQRGTLLMELAICVFVITLILGAIAVPLSTLVEQRQIRETQKALNDIRVALLGFAQVNGRLPCPDTDDPATLGYGDENSPCDATALTEGFLPWRTLTLEATVDGFGTPGTSESQSRLGHWRYRIDRNFAQPVAITTVCNPDDALVVVQSNKGPDVDITPTIGLNADDTVCDRPLSASCDCAKPPARPVAIVFSTGPDLVPNRHNANFEPTSGRYEASDRREGPATSSFDDIVMWIDPHTLKGAMVAAGKLP